MTESFGEHYQRVMREEFGERRVHVMSEWALPGSVVIGQWVMYLPLEITEGMNMTPRLTQVTDINFSDGSFKIMTKDGIMVLRPNDKIQVVV